MSALWFDATCRVVGKRRHVAALQKINGNRRANSKPRSRAAAFAVAIVLAAAEARRIAMVGGVILIFLYLVALFAGFVAPYRYDRLDTNYSFHPPIWPRLQGFHLVVPRYEQGGGVFAYHAVANDTKPLHFFVRGDKYKLFGLIPASIHLVRHRRQRLSGLSARRGPVRARRFFAAALRLANLAVHRRHRHFAVVFVRHDHRRHFRLFLRRARTPSSCGSANSSCPFPRCISSFRCARRFRRA